MKLSALVTFAAGASLAQVGAIPLRMIIVSSSISEGLPPNMRNSMAVPYTMGSGPDHNIHKVSNYANPTSRRPCGGRMGGKAIELSNAFRKALGWPTIETDMKATDSGRVRILPFIGTPPTFIDLPSHGDLPVPRPIGHPGFHPHPHHRHHPHDQPSFMTRLHFSLTALGPWEGRAVAFVLGCGIGVLLRMFWVLAIISYRALNGSNDDETEYTHLVVEEYPDAEEIVVAPPTYTYIDEKSDNKVVEAAPVTAAANN